MQMVVWEGFYFSSEVPRHLASSLTVQRGLFFAAHQDHSMQNLVIIAHILTRFQAMPA